MADYQQWLLVAAALLVALWQTKNWLFTRLDLEACAQYWPRNMHSDTVRQHVEQLLARMTLQEKIAQMSGDGGAAILPKLGIFVLLLKRFPNIYSGYNKRLNIPPLSFTDGPRGIVIGNATCFPVAMLRGASWDAELERQIGEVIGREARASGANYFAGLCVNLLRHPAWGRAQETYGEDSVHLGIMGSALMHGVQSQHVMVCAKHFAVNSIENSRFYLDVQIDEQTLHEVYLPHFKYLVDHGIDSLMSAYNRINGDYCGHSAPLLHDILRQQWQFEGFVSSDWLWGIYETQKPVLAGMDVEMPYAQFYGRHLLRAVKKGQVPESVINDSVRRILNAKLRWLTTLPDESLPAELIASSDHRALAQTSAEQSMVLLKNHKHTLPLYRDKLQTLLVIGELATQPCLGDHGSSRVSPPDTVTFLQGLQDYLQQDVRIIFCDGRNPQQAASLAREADAVLLIAGYHAEDEGENLTSNRKPVKNPKVPRGGDRRSLHLNAQQENLISTVCEQNARSIVAVVAGSAVMMNRWQDQAAAIVFAGYPGMHGGHALARLLFGEVNPSGKLPFSIPASEAQLPAFDCWSETARYDYFHGYTLLDKMQVQPAFAFGFGLSYTDFRIGTPHLQTVELCEDDTLIVNVDVCNAGSHHGAEVIQCYIGIEQPQSQPTARKQLRTFQKVWLAPGESKAISLRVPVQQLARYHSDTGTWQVEKGNYCLWAGNSSRETDLQQTGFRVI